MANEEQQWPPAWWPFPLKDDSWLAVIPYMDCMQWLYESAKKLANMIPHQPPTFTRDVNGFILSLNGTREKVGLGSIGYDAKERKVLITTNTTGGTANKTIKIDVSVIFPMLMVLLTRLPWDIVAEMNSAVMSGMSAKEKARYAANGISDNKMIVRWLTDKVRATASEIDISLPALNGSYAGTNKMSNEGFASLVPSTANLVLYNIPIMDYCQAIYEAVMELVDTINHHPPAATFPVVARAFYPQFIFQLINDDDKTIYDSDTMPSFSDIQGNTLRIVLRASSDGSVTNWNNLDDPEKTYDNPSAVPCGDVVLVERQFLPSSSTATYTSTTNAPDANIVKGKKLFLELNNGYAPEVIVTDVRQGTEGHEASGEPDTPEYIPAEEPAPTIFTVSITAKTVAGDSETVEAGVDLSALNTKNIYGDLITLEAVATADGEQNVKLDDTVTFTENDVHGFVSKVTSKGTDAPVEDDTGGTGESGTPAVVQVSIYSSSDTRITFAAGEHTVQIGGVDYKMSVKKATDLEPSPALAYTAQLDGPDAIQAMPEEISVQVCAPVYAAGNFFRWTDPESLTYIGKELNFQLGMSGVGLSRYVLARIKYRYSVDKKKHYRYTRSVSDYKPGADGYGNCHPMDIKYNASTKIVTLVDRLGGDTLEMRLQSCAWFMLQLLMLIPVTVI